MEASGTVEHAPVLTSDATPQSPLFSKATHLYFQMIPNTRMPQPSTWRCHSQGQRDSRGHKTFLAVLSFCSAFIPQKAGPAKPDTKPPKETPFRLRLSMPPAVTFLCSSPAVLRRLSQQMHLGCSQVGMKFA